MYDDPDNLVARLIDDKKLIENFENVEQKGYLEGRKISANKADFAFSFVICLLRCRFLFDKYIIKREFVDEDTIDEVIEWFDENADYDDGEFYARYHFGDMLVCVHYTSEDI